MPRPLSPKRAPTEIEQELLGHLIYVSMLRGLPAKRFIRDMHAAWIGLDKDFHMTERQLAYMARIAWRHRRQLPASLVAVAALKGGTMKHGENATPGPSTPAQAQCELPF